MVFPTNGQAQILEFESSIRTNDVDNAHTVGPAHRGPPTHRDAPKLARRPPGVSGVVVWVVAVAVAVHPTHMEMHARESAAPAGWQ